MDSELESAIAGLLWMTAWLVLLKVSGAVPISWWVVLSPLWMLPALVLGIVAIGVALYILVALLRLLVKR